MNRNLEGDIQQLHDGARRLGEKHHCFVVEFDFASLTTIVAALQLTLRHPRMRGSYVGDIVRHFVDEVLSAIELEEPECAALLRRGDDPKYDVPSP